MVVCACLAKRVCPPPPSLLLFEKFLKLGEMDSDVRTFFSSCVRYDGSWTSVGEILAEENMAKVDKLFSCDHAV